MSWRKIYVSVVLFTVLMLVALHQFSHYFSG